MRRKNEICLNSDSIIEGPRDDIDFEIYVDCEGEQFLLARKYVDLGRAQDMISDRTLKKTA